jgi:hypothetical protein
MREVIDAFLAGKAKNGETCSTNGETIFSYRLPIAARRGGRLLVLDRKHSPSNTTSGQISACMFALPGAEVVSDLFAEAP